MERISHLDFTLKLFGIVGNAQDEGFGEDRVKSDSLNLLRIYMGQDNYEDLRMATMGWLATREIGLTEAERIEMHKGNPEYFI